MSALRKTALLSALVGFCVALTLTGLAYYENAHANEHSLSDFRQWDLVFKVFFPTSIGLKATERVGILGQVFVVCVVSLQNALLYGLLGWVIAWIARKLLKMSTHL